jgi:hypothetical protein
MQKYQCSQEENFSQGSFDTRKKTKKEKERLRRNACL